MNKGIWIQESLSQEKGDIWTVGWKDRLLNLLLTKKQLLISYILQCDGVHYIDTNLIFCLLYYVHIYIYILAQG